MAKYSVGLQEDELKKKVAVDWFAAFDTMRSIGKVDFCVAIPATELSLFEAENALWAEAKAGIKKDIHESFVQLILTIGRARTFDHERPPIFLGAFDAEKIAFLPYTAVMSVFDQNDFNWNVTPSNHGTKEFAQLHKLAEKTIAEKSLLFDFLNDSFDKLPEGLRQIVGDPEQRKKLVVYINPPYKEHADARQISHSGKNMSGVAKETKVYDQSQGMIGTAARELFAQFLFRIHDDLSGYVIGHFSTLARPVGKFRQTLALREVKGKIEPDIPVWKSVTVGRVKDPLNAFAQACLCCCR